MAFQYVNGLQIGRSAFDFARGARLFHKFMYLFLKKVVGWQEQHKTGVDWDDPLVTGTDGATDASNPRRFTSAAPSVSFDATMEHQYLMVFPTAAPAAAGGFTDQSRNGIYRISRVYDANTLDVEIFNGVHTDGLPLSETGLNYEIVKMRDNADCPENNDLWVLRGTGVGGDFDFKHQENHGVNYSPDNFILSPFADWVGTDWNITTRLVPNATGQLNAHNFDSEIAWVWGFADESQAVFWVRYYNTGLGTNDNTFIYIGEFTPFHTDPKPYIFTTQNLGGSLDEYPALDGDLRGLAGDDTTAITYRAIYHCQSAVNATSISGNSARTNLSYHSGRFVRLPIMIGNSGIGTEEIRGTLKNVEFGHFHGPRGPIPLGTSRDRIRFFTQMVGKWNGSKIFRYVV